MIRWLQSRQRLRLQLATFGMASIQGLSAWAAGPALATTGCPIFHCTPEVTGVMGQPLLSNPTTLVSNKTLGKLEHQGCSGDSTRVACLFTVDNVASGIGMGTLKVLDPKTLMPSWGSVGAANSSDIDPATFSTGQVPILFSDGTVAAGDSSHFVLYGTAGEALKQLALNGRGKNMGMTPISAKYGVITQSNGTFTLVDLATWTKVSDLTLKAEGSNVQVLSPSTGTANVLYSVAANGGSGHGFLFALAVHTDSRGVDKLVLRSTFTFLGKPTASAVVVKPQATGFGGNLVLLYVPGLLTDGSAPKKRLMGLLDLGTAAFAEAWNAPIALADAITVSPGIDEVSQSLFFRYSGDAIIHRYDFTRGVSTGQYDIRAIGGFPDSFKLNGHVASSQSGGIFTLLLSGAYKETSSDAAQYVLAYRPFVSPGALLWSRKVSASPDSYTAAWTLVPSSVSGNYCPLVVGKSSGISRVCD